MMEREVVSARVRAAKIGDAHLIDRVICYLDDVHARARPDLFRTPIGKPRGDDFVSTIVEDPLQKLFVALLGGQVVGYLHVLIKHTPASPWQVERHFGEIDSVAVLPEAQRLGLGREMIQTALEWLTSQGVDDHQIAAHAFNDAARRLYEELGFTLSVTLLRRQN